MTDGAGTVVNSVNPYEMAFDLGYSRKLSESFSMGVALRYIYSDLAFSDAYSAEQQKGASAFADHISCGGTQRMPMVMGFQHLQHRF